MENASKALLIAGAILIAILLIGVGMMVFGNIGGITGQAGQQMDAMEIQAFNRQFDQYIGENVSGANVKQLINTVNTVNATSFANYNDSTNQIEVVDKTTTPAITTSKTTSPYKISGSVSSNARYKVETVKNNAGFVYQIEITKK